MTEISPICLVLGALRVVTCLGEALVSRTI